MFLPRNNRYVLVSTLVLLCSTAAFTQGLRWSKAAPFPEPDEELYGVSANGKMFVLGGFGNVRGKNYEYDPASDSLKVSDFRISRLEGDQLAPMMKTTLNLKLGQTVILGVTKEAQSQRALMIVVTAKR